MLWDEVRRMPIVSSLRDVAAGIRREAAESDPERAAHLEAVAAEIDATVAKRVADERFHIGIRHIGSPEDPFRLASLNAAHQSAVHKAKTRARKLLRDEGADISESAVNEAMDRDPEWKRELGRVVRDWFDAGVENADAEYHRLYALGFELGGPGLASQLLLHAMGEIRRAQEVPPELGKA